MQRPTRWRILLLSLIAAATFSTGLAAILQTATRDEFPALRTAIAHTLSGMVMGVASFIPFWIACFTTLLVVSGIAYLLFYYGKPALSGPILSKDGILLFDREQQVAISVGTLKSILSTLANEAPKGRANELLFRAGELAGKRFGGAFEEIYIGQIAPYGGKPWPELKDNERLDAWERYDATVGWGQINAHKFESNAIVDVVFRHPALYEGSGGELFSWLLAGYAKEVVAALIKRNMHFDPATGFVRDEGILRLHYTY